MRMPRISLVAVALLGALLVGCTPNACPAVAWGNTAAVTLEGPTPEATPVAFPPVATRSTARSWSF